MLRLVRATVELGLFALPDTLALARSQAPGLAGVSGERVLAELRRIVSSPQPRAGIELMSDIGALAAVLPEIDALRGIEQSAYHHADVYEHTLEVLDRTADLTAPGGLGAESVQAAVGANEQRAGALLDEPLADEMTRGQALRWGALLHDAAKPLTRAVRPEDGRVTFMGHDRVGAELARTVLGRLRSSERLRSHVAALVRQHLRLGFLVHEPQPLARRTVYRYLRVCAPVQADVTLLSVADRLATRGRRSQEAIAAHLALAGEVLERRARLARGAAARAARARRRARRRAGDRAGPRARPPARGARRGALRRRDLQPRAGRRACACDARRRVIGGAEDVLLAAPSGDLRLGSAPMTDPDCIFCKIVAGELPATIVDEDERTIAFMDIAPATRGHALVIPREHSRDLLAVSSEDLQATAQAAQRLARRASERLGADGVNLLNSCGSAAWQTVFHFHIHVIPRYDGDPLRLPWIPSSGDPRQIAAAAQELTGG